MNEIENAVVEQLVKLGVPATHEYPGYICIATGRADCWNLGKQTEHWGGEMTRDGEVVATIDFDIPVDCADAEKIAALIRQALRA